MDVPSSVTRNLQRDHDEIINTETWPKTW